MGERNRLSGVYAQGAVTQVFKASPAIDPPSVGAGAKTSITTTVTGAQVGDSVEVQPPSNLETGLIPLAARVSAANTVQIDLYNPTAGAIDGTSRTWNIIVKALA